MRNKKQKLFDTMQEMLGEFTPAEIIGAMADVKADMGSEFGIFIPDDFIRLPHKWDSQILKSCQSMLEANYELASRMAEHLDENYHVTGQ